MKYIKSQRGVAAILEIILVVVVIGAVGFVAYRAGLARSQKSELVQTHSDKQPAKTDPYAGWKDFTSKIDGLTFKYPADWKADIQNNPGFDNSTVESVDITAPSGLTVHYLNPASGFGGSCEDPCQIKTHTYSHELAVSGSLSPVYLVKQRVIQPAEKDPINGVRIGLLGLNPSGFGKTDYSLDRPDYIGFPPYTVFNGRGKMDSQSTDANLVYFYADSLHVDKNGKDLGAITAASPEKWFNLPDVKTAELILKSVHY